MNCADFEQLIALQAGGDLSGREATELASHLEQCAPCRQLAAEMAADLDWLHAAHREPADCAALHQVRTSVMRQLEAEQGRWKGPWGRWLPIPWVWQVVAASAALAMLVGGVAWWRATSHSAVEEMQVVQKNPEPARPQPEVKKFQPEPQEKQIVADSTTKPRARKSARKPKTIASPSQYPPATEVRPAAMELVRVDLEPKSDEPASEAVMVKIPTSNPDIVVYWLMDDPNKGD